MRKIISFFLVVLFTASTVLPLFGQKLRSVQDRKTITSDRTLKSKGPKQQSKKDLATFAVTEAFTAGSGVLIHWKMDVERNNLGFAVHRIDAGGDRIVSEFIPGSALKVGEMDLYDQDYSYFDRTGNPGSVYYVEAQASTKTPVNSSVFAPVAVKDLPNIPGVGRYEPASKTVNDALFTKTALTLPLDLQAEVKTSQALPDPIRHKEVIALPGAKIETRDSGIIRVTKAQLETAGFNVNSDTNLWQLYLDGVERAIIIGPNADYIEFFGQTIDTLESNTRTFYLILGTGAGKRFRTLPSRPPTSFLTSRRYSQTFSRKDRMNYNSGILNGDSENWWGRAITTLGATYNFNLSGIDQTAGDRTMRLTFQGNTFTAHNVLITLNGNVLEPVTASGRQPFSKEYTIPVSYLVEGNNALQMQSSAAGDSSLFDTISIDFPRQYQAIGDQLDFYTDSNKTARLSGFSTSNIRVFDLTFELYPAEVTGLQVVETNGSFGPIIPAARGRVLYAAEAGKYSTPVSVVANNPEMLGVPTQSAQLVIISHSSLLAEAQAWANYRMGQGFTAKVISVDDIFDEFNSGVASSQSITDFLNYAEHNWQTPPQYVLLLGDASVNPKNYPDDQGIQWGYFNMVPARQVSTVKIETGSDEALADFNNDGLAEIPIGRISARLPAEAQTVLNKTMLWESSLTANSMDRGGLFAYDQPVGYDFRAMSDRMMALLPASMPKTTVMRGVPDNATAKATVINAINNGPFLMNYTGHGTTGAWRDTGFFWSVDVPSLTNSTTPSLFMSLTCLNGYFTQFNNTNSLAETMIKATNGGAVSAWASTGETTPDVQEVMGSRFFSQLSAGNIVRLGDLVNDAKAQVVGGTDVRLSWALLGDPMLKVR